ncbi:UNVERIFIED_CONTAM: hypothetical protein Sradi_7287300 [Sesamum radiatum]|uniref:Uncharacterized protein n=1 Tax=Sesamum radiatum TaxID=300843 RepID=A0AAW2IJL7_SESRA
MEDGSARNVIGLLIVTPVSVQRKPQMESSLRRAQHQRPDDGELQAPLLCLKERRGKHSRVEERGGGCGLRVEEF